jgi:glycosyltransferase involved in cell wall biosynthesis
LGIPLLKTTPFTTTIHDLAAWHFPWTMSPGVRYYYRHLISAALRSRKLRKAIAVSRATKDDLVRLFGIDENRVTVIHRSLAPHFASIAARPDDQTGISRVLRRYGISRSYILAVGTLEPRKNLRRLINAFRLLRGKYGVDGYDLVIVGRRGWGRAPESAPDVVGGVHMVGTVPDEDLVSLYRGAAAFVLPSLYEGFGLPLLEAMACGTPVVASNTSSIPEVAGQAAAYFDPTDEAEMARAIYTVLSNPGLRERLVAGGYERVREFDHNEAEETIAELEKAAREGLRG